MKNAIYKIEGSVGREVSISNKKYIFCSGTSYLGFWSNKSYHKKIARGFTLFGSNFPMSRISNLRLSIFDEFEKYLSSIYMGYESITFSSGYLTGQALTGAIGHLGECIFDQNIHPALKNNYFNGNIIINNEKENVVKYINKSINKKFLIFTNSVNSLYGEILNFEWIHKLNKNNKIYLILDDSHGFGVIGKSNRGIIDYLPKLPNIEYIIISSLGKAYGIPGGVVLCSEKIKSILQKSSFYTASSPIIPAYIYACLNSISIRDDLVNKLQDNINKFRSGIENADIFKFSSTFPVFYTTQNKLFEHCLKSNIFISSFPYPKEEDENITRIVINAQHTNSDISQMIESCKSFIESK